MECSSENEKTPLLLKLDDAVDAKLRHITDDEGYLPGICCDHTRHESKFVHDDDNDDGENVTDSTCWITYTLFCLLGFMARATAMPVLSEVPVLAQVVPEGWDLPSYGSLLYIVNIASVVVLFSVQRFSFPFTTVVSAFYMVVALEIICYILLIFVWDITAFIGSEAHSVALLSIFLVLILADFMATYLSLLYASKYKTVYVSALFAGEGVGSIFTAVLAVIQGVGVIKECVNVTEWHVDTDTGSSYTTLSLEPLYQPPRFSVSIYFFITALSVCVPLLALACLQYLPICRRQLVDQTKTIKSNTIRNLIRNVSSTKEQSSQIDQTRHKKLELSTLPIAILMILIFLSSSLSINNSLLPYSAIPYGSLAYSLAVQLGSALYPLACLLIAFMPVLSVTSIGMIGFSVLPYLVWEVYLATLSPSPPLSDSAVGLIVMV